MHASRASVTLTRVKLANGVRDQGGQWGVQGEHDLWRRRSRALTTERDLEVCAKTKERREKLSAEPPSGHLDDNLRSSIRTPLLLPDLREELPTNACSSVQSSRPRW
jgi:hypothetical protein